jgi:hypothetical protein
MTQRKKTGKSMTANYLNARIIEAYREYDSCIAMMRSAFDALFASEIDLNRLVATFVAAAHQRNATVNELLRLIEQAPQA